MAEIGIIGFILFFFILTFYFSIYNHFKNIAVDVSQIKKELTLKTSLSDKKTIIEKSKQEYFYIIELGVVNQHNQIHNFGYNCFSSAKKDVMEIIKNKQQENYDSIWHEQEHDHIWSNDNEFIKIKQIKRK